MRQVALEAETKDFVANLRKAEDGQRLDAEVEAVALVPHQAKSKKKKKPRLPQLLAPLDCTILGVDAAGNSGWALWRGGQLLDFGEVDVFSAQVDGVFDAVLAQPGPHVLVVERPFRVKNGNTTGIGTGEKIWREYAKRHGFSKRIVRVYPATWRSRTLPKGMASAKREIVRPEELKAAREVAGYQLGNFMRGAVGDDSAPAILIGKWATFSPVVEKLLPKRRAKQVPLALVEPVMRKPSQPPPPARKRAKKAKAA